MDLSLSILIPLFNEEEFVGELLRRVVAAQLPDGMTREVIIVNDCSTDGSVEIVQQFIARHPDENIRLLHHSRNRGKGAAIRTAIQAATAHYSVIQDADLEYNPAEIPRLLTPLLEGNADVVYGSRFLVAGERRVLYFWHALANSFLTTLCNIVADLNLTDMETCYKAFRTAFIKTIPIENDRFGIEPELTVKFARRNARIYETPISYHGRTYEDGKKIGPKDAVEALWVILRSRFSRRLYADPAAEVVDALSRAPRFNQWTASMIEPWTGARVLEIGAGLGNMTKHLCRRRQLYLATDSDPNCVEHLRNIFQHRPSIEARQFDADSPADYLPWQGQLDTVLCLRVIEHLEYDQLALQRAASTLRPDGRIILIVPNDPAAEGTLDRALGRFRRYTPDQLRTLLTNASCEVEKILPINRAAYPGWIFNGRILKTKTLSAFSVRLFDKLVWLWKKTDAHLPWPATSLLVIARKKSVA